MALNVLWAVPTLLFVLEVIVSIVDRTCIQQCVCLQNRCLPDRVNSGHLDYLFLLFCTAFGAEFMLDRVNGATIVTTNSINTARRRTFGFG